MSIRQLCLRPQFRLPLASPDAFTQNTTANAAKSTLKTVISLCLAVLQKEEVA